MSSTQFGVDAPATSHMSGRSNQSEYQSSSRTVVARPTPLRIEAIVKQLPVFERTPRRGVPSPVQEQTWDDPPPEESERAESAKSGPPAYTPDSPLPTPLEPSLQSFRRPR